MGKQRDQFNGLNSDQSGPIEKIQNGDPKAGANRDQRSGAREAGGPGGSLQQAPTGKGTVEPHDDRYIDHGDGTRRTRAGLYHDHHLPAGSYDRAGSSPSLTNGSSLLEATGGPGGVKKVTMGEEGKTQTESLLEHKPYEGSGGQKVDPQLDTGDKTGKEHLDKSGDGGAHQPTQAELDAKEQNGKENDEKTGFAKIDEMAKNGDDKPLYDAKTGKKLEPA